MSASVYGHSPDGRAKSSVSNVQIDLDAICRLVVLLLIFGVVANGWGGRNAIVDMASLVKMKALKTIMAAVLYKRAAS